MVLCLFFQGGDIAKGNGEFAQLVVSLHFSIPFPSWGKKQQFPCPLSWPFSFFVFSYKVMFLCTST